MIIACSKKNFQVYYQSVKQLEARLGSTKNNNNNITTYLVD